jgi:dephospho-CoA kinase
MLKVGITGGIGAGKSVVCKIFEVLNIPVYNADEAAKMLMERDHDLVKQIKESFTDEAYSKGKLNRKFLSDLIFNDSSKREKLNSIVHPFVIQNGYEWMNQQKSPYAIKEAALIFESGSQESLDHIIGVFAPNSLRINRTMKRDLTTRENVMFRMQSQLDEKIKMKLCDDVIINDEQHLLIEQVLNIHERLCKKAMEKSKHE